jgi:hypothetical protein
VLRCRALAPGPKRAFARFPRLGFLLTQRRGRTTKEAAIQAAPLRLVILDDDPHNDVRQLNYKIAKLCVFFLQFVFFLKFLCVRSIRARYQCRIIDLTPIVLH